MWTLYFYLHFTEVGFLEFNWLWFITGSDNGLVQDRRQAMIWTNDYLVQIQQYIYRNHPRQQSSWGQHGAHPDPAGSRWAPCWPHEPCYQGLHRWCWFALVIASIAPASTASEVMMKAQGVIIRGWLVNWLFKTRTLHIMYVYTTGNIWNIYLYIQYMLFIIHYLNTVWEIVHVHKLEARSLTFKNALINAIFIIRHHAVF